MYCLHGVSGTSLKVKSRLLCKFVLQRGVSMLAAITYKINTRDPCTEGALQSYLWRSRRLEGALTTHNLQLTEFWCYQVQLYNCQVPSSSIKSCQGALELQGLQQSMNLRWQERSRSIVRLAAGGGVQCKGGTLGAGLAHKL